MAFRRKKKSVIDQRLKELDREMARLDHEVKAISRPSGLRALEAPDRRPGKSFKPAGPHGRNADLSGTAFVDFAEDDLEKSASELGTEVGMMGSVSQNAAREARSSSQAGMRARERSGGREKFVSYFAAGHFEHLRPVRENTRVLRNKAIMMLILVILAAFGLFRFLMRH